MFLWIVVLTVIAVSVLLPVLILYSPFNFESDPFFPFLSNPFIISLFIFVPMLCLLLILGCGCNAKISPEEQMLDDKIFDSMRKRAAPAEHVADLDRYRCPECETSFELNYAEPVDENIVLCPICKTRLFIE